VNRAAINQNFDATVWGLELETDWRPLENLRLGFKGGYEKTRVADGMKAVDVMDRTAGDPNWVVVRPFPTFPSNCIVPAWIFVGVPHAVDGGTETGLVDVGNRGSGSPGPCEIAYLMGLDPVTGLQYQPNPTEMDGALGTLDYHPGYPGWDPSTAPNNGAGISKSLSGNELPNAPHFTATITADYTVPMPNDWLMTLHTDLYYQSEAWARIFNTPGYDKLKAYSNVNLAAIFTNEDAGWKVMAYVKNVFDKTNITGAFLNSDDSGLTTNVFMTEPRLYGLRITKEWNGGPWWTGAGANHTGPYPFTVELGGMLARTDAQYGIVDPEAFATLGQALDPSAGIQNRDFDWGDGRSIKLTYQPVGSAWELSADARYARANTAMARAQATLDEVHDACFVDRAHDSFGFYDLVCYPGAPFYDLILATQPNLVQFPTRSWTDVAIHSREERRVVDLKAARDLGANGFLASSSIGLGLRYAGFSSKSFFEGSALGDWNIVDGTQVTPSTYQVRHANLQEVRKFDGLGPVLSWDGAVSLWRGENASHFDVDWDVTAGALYGNQKTSTGGQQTTTMFTGIPEFFPGESGTPVVIASPASRSKSATVPLVDLSLGTSYEMGRVKVGAGYRWERYYNVLDAGYATRQRYDRTIDGPYFKIAVGFGG